jgi:hypothetical protein
MKTLLKIAVVVVLARLMVHTPQGTNRALDTVNSFTLRDLAYQVDRWYVLLQETVLSWIG